MTTTPYTYNPRQVSAFSSQDEAIKALDKSYVPEKQVIQPPTSTPTDPVFRYTGADPALSYMGSRFNGAPAAFSEQDAESIREATRKRFQTELDAVDKEFDILRGREVVAGEGREGQLRAIQARGGTTEAPSGMAQKTKVQDYTNENIRLLGEQKAQRISQIFNKIEDKADEEIKLKREEATTNAKDYLTFLSGAKEETREDLKLLARTGARLENLEPDKLQQYMRLGGFDSVEALQMYIDDNKKDAEKPDWFFQEIIRGADGKAFYKQVGLDPITGEKIDRSTPLGMNYDDLKDAKTQVIDGVLHEQQKDGSWKPVAGRGFTTFDKESSKVDTEVVEVGNKKYLINSQTGATIREIGAGESVGGKEENVLTDKIKIIDNLLVHKGLDSRVGPTSASRRAFAISDKFGSGQDFAGGVKQLVNKETIDTLVNLKERGGTLGALSDQERILLQTAATKIGDWEVRDDKGTGKGEWNIDEAAFKKELNTIKELAARAIRKSLGYDPSLIGDDDMNEVKNIYGEAFNPANFY